MEHSAHLVDVLDDAGNIIAQKRRKDIQKESDIYHAVYGLLITPDGKVIISTIRNRTDLPNLYAEQIGAPVATIRRAEETAEQAASRSWARELFIDNPELHLLGEGMATLPDGRKSFISAFYAVGEAPDIFSSTDIDELTAISATNLRSKILNQPGAFAPTFRHIWQQYAQKLPL